MPPAGNGKRIWVRRWRIGLLPQNDCGITTPYVLLCTCQKSEGFASCLSLSGVGKWEDSCEFQKTQFLFSKSCIHLSRYDVVMICVCVSCQDAATAPR